MLKVVLYHHDTTHDTLTVNRVLAEGTKILRTKKLPYGYRITILVENYEELNEVLMKLNQESDYGVITVRVKRYRPNSLLSHSSE